MAQGEAEQLLIDQCEELEERIRNLQVELVRQRDKAPILPDPINRQQSICQEKQRLMKAQIDVYNDQEPSVLPQNETILNAVVKNDFTKLNSQLESTVTFAKTQLDELVDRIQAEKENNAQLIQIQASLQEKLSSLRSEQEKSAETSEVSELGKKEKKLAAKKKKILKFITEFCEKHFPAPTGAQMSASQAEKCSDEVVPLIAMIKELINLSLNHAHDPYMTLTPQHWPPYTEMLLRCGLAVPHPRNSQKIKLTPFHL